MSKHLTQDECISLFLTGLFAPALIIGGFTAIAVGLHPGLSGLVADSRVVPVILGGAGFGAGCGLLGVLGFYFWHRWTVIEGQRAADKVPLEYEEE